MDIRKVLADMGVTNYDLWSLRGLLDLGRELENHRTHPQYPAVITWVRNEWKGW